MRPGIFLILALLAPVPAMAQSQGGVQPLDRLLPEIRRTHPGQFYDADGPHPGPGGSQHYHLKWLTPDGRIVWYDTDARTGRVIGASPGRDSFDAGRGPDRFGGSGRYDGRPLPPEPSEIGRGRFREGGYGPFGGGFGGRYYGGHGFGYGARGNSGGRARRGH